MSAGSAPARLRAVVVSPRRAPGTALPQTPASEGFAALLAETRPLCANAVDALEVAAGLEADGLNDASVRARYGEPDVFVLAERLYRAVPRRPDAAGAARPNPWTVEPGKHLLRGLLFALPGLPFVALGRLFAEAAALAVVVVSLLLAWAASEALAYLAGVVTGRSGPSSAARVLRWGAGVSAAVLLPAVGVTAAALGAGPSATGYAAGQAVYLLAATIVLVGGGERVLLAALAPGTVGSLLVLLGAAEPSLAIACALLSLAATVIAALVRTRGSSPTGLGWAGQLRPVTAQAASGLLAGALVSFGALHAVLSSGDGRGAAVGAVAVLPITLTMGCAEWILVAFRRRTSALLGSTLTLRLFAVRAGWALAGAAVGYLALLVTLTAALAHIGVTTGRFVLSADRIAASVLLGGALFLGLLLRSFGFTGVVVAASAAVLGVEVALTVLLRPPVATLPELLASGALFAMLAAVAFTTLTKASVHR